MTTHDARESRPVAVLFGACYHGMGFVEVAPSLRFFVCQNLEISLAPLASRWSRFCPCDNESRRLLSRHWPSNLAAQSILELEGLGRMETVIHFVARCVQWEYCFSANPWGTDHE